jgi:hypothetical protein
VTRCVRTVRVDEHIDVGKEPAAWLRSEVFRRGGWWCA